VALLLQLPPAVTQLKVVVIPTVRSVVPVMEATTGNALFVSPTSSVDSAQGLFEIVHLSVALLPAGTPVTPELYEDVEVMVAVPLTTLHAPVPTEGLFPARVKLPL
jgi:hypothetical protein